MAISHAGSSNKFQAAPAGTNYRSAFAMVTTLFFVWGFLTSLNDILIPHLKAIFDLDYAKAMLVQFAFFGSYAAFGYISGKIVEWIGYKRTMVLGLVTMGVGALLFIPAANTPSFALFLTALIVLAAGITALQVAANPYVTVLGPAHTASSRLNLTQAFNSLGTTIGPPLGGWLILKGAETAIDLKTATPQALHAFRLQQAATVKMPYLAITVALILLALTIWLYKFPRLDNTKDYRPTQAGQKGDSIWRYPHVILGAVAIFTYVGAEVSLGSFLINYFNLPNIAGISVLAAAGFVPFYWGGAMIGRFIGSAVLQKLKTTHVLTFCAVVAMALVFISMGTSYSSGAVTDIHLNLLFWQGTLALPHSWPMWTILAVGFFNSIMFPSIFTLGIAEMGPLTGEASGLLVTAIVGGAILPEIQGILADKIGLQHAFIVPILCYLFIAYYGWRGSRIIQPAPKQA